MLWILVQSDIVNDLILFVAHCDLYLHGPLILPYISGLFSFTLRVTSYFCRSLWPTFHSPMILPCISISILFYPITLEGRRGTTDEFATIPFHIVLFSAALGELANSIPVNSLILSSHLFFCLPHFLCPFTVP